MVATECQQLAIKKYFFHCHLQKITATIIILQ